MGLYVPFGQSASVFPSQYFPTGQISDAGFELVDFSYKMFLFVKKTEYIKTTI